MIYGYEYEYSARRSVSVVSLAGGGGMSPLCSSRLIRLVSIFLARPRTWSCGPYLTTSTYCVSLLSTAVLLVERVESAGLLSSSCCLFAPPKSWGVVDPLFSLDPFLSSPKDLESSSSRFFVPWPFIAL